MSVKIHQSLYVSTALTQWGFKMARNIRQQQTQEQEEMLVGLYPEKVVTSGAAMFVWFPFLSFVYLAVRSRCQHSQRPLEFPHHNVFMLALINSLYIYNETYSLIEKWKLDLVDWKESLTHSRSFCHISVVHHMNTKRRPRSAACLHATSANKPNQLCSV